MYNKLSTKYTHLSSPTDVIRFVHYYVRTYTAALTEEDLLAISIMTRRTTLIMGYKRQGPKYQYWKSLILGQISVLASLGRLLFLKHTNYPLDKW